MRLSLTLVLCLICGLSWSQTKSPLAHNTSFDVVYTSLKVYPNPVASQATLEFKLAQPALVRVSLLNILGAEVRVIVRESLPQGDQNIRFNADQLEKGTYFLRLTVNGDIVKTIRVAVSNRS